ncbi:MAG: PAS domain-containing protein [Cycloclasticus sp.]
MEECGIHLRLKKGDEQLHSDEIDRYRAIFDLSPNPIIIYGESGIVDLNKATLTMFAIPTVDAYSQYALARFSAADAAAWCYIKKFV